MRVWLFGWGLQAGVYGLSLQPIGCTSALLCDVSRYCSCSCSFYLYLYSFTLENRKKNAINRLLTLMVTLSLIRTINLLGGL